MTKLIPNAIVFGITALAVVHFSFEVMAACSLGNPNGPPETFCEGYANSALSQADTAKRGRCGYTGPRWTTIKEDHRRWCLSFGNDQTAPCNEYNARYREIEACWAWCRKYGVQATDAANKNEKLGCGFTGPRWSIERDDHVIWCQFTATRTQADADTAVRSAALDECTRNRPATHDKDSILKSLPKKDPCPPKCEVNPDGLKRYRRN